MMMAVVIILFFFRGIRKVVKIEIVGGRWGWWRRHDGVMVDVGSGLVWRRFTFSSWSASASAANFDFFCLGRVCMAGFKPPLSFFLAQVWPVLPVFISNNFSTRHITLLNLLNNELQRATCRQSMRYRQLLGSFFGTKAPQY